jgi:ribosomal protein S18 acetylase RimI-like enzyme
MPESQVGLRHAEPEDHAAIIRVLDEWWGGRQMADMLPRLFFTHFRPTSFIAEVEGEVVGFLTGFVSQSDPSIGYVHFIGVDPERRGLGIGETLYMAFFAAAEGQGCRTVRAVTSPVNRNSIAFHQRIGFRVLPGDAEAGGVPYTSDYDGPDRPCVRFEYDLERE